MPGRALEPLGALKAPQTPSQATGPHREGRDQTLTKVQARFSRLLLPLPGFHIAVLKLDPGQPLQGRVLEAGSGVSVEVSPPCGLGSSTAEARAASSDLYNRYIAGDRGFPCSYDQGNVNTIADTNV